MGTDIHGVFQRRTEHGWETVPSEYDEGRHYQLFAVLAGVRNGRGFAGIQTGEPVVPISAPRGLPADFALAGGDQHPVASVEMLAPWRLKYRVPDEPLEVWMGDHSHSWLTSAEMLTWYGNAPTVVQRGVLDKEQYHAWDKVSPPEAYCGAVYGEGLVTINEAEVAHVKTPWTHVECTWESGLKQELAYFFDEVRRLHDLHGGVRFVFGFDS